MQVKPGVTRVLIFLYLSRIAFSLFTNQDEVKSHGSLFSRRMLISWPKSSNCELSKQRDSTSPYYIGFSSREILFVSRLNTCHIMAIMSISCLSRVTNSFTVPLSFHNVISSEIVLVDGWHRINSPCTTENSPLARTSYLHIFLIFQVRSSEIILYESVIDAYIGYERRRHSSICI